GDAGGGHGPALEVARSGPNPVSAPGSSSDATTSTKPSRARHASRGPPLASARGAARAEAPASSSDAPPPPNPPRARHASRSPPLASATAAARAQAIGRSPEVSA